MWSGSAKPVSVPVTILGSESSPVSHARMMFSVACRCAWWWYLVWAVCSYMTIFITIETSYIGTMVCHVSWFLSLKTCHLHLTWHLLWMRAVVWQLTAVLLEASLPPWWHLPGFGAPFHKSHWQSASIPKSLYEYLNRGCIVVKVASVGFPFKSVDICC